MDRNTIAVCLICALVCFVLLSGCLEAIREDQNKSPAKKAKPNDQNTNIIDDNTQIVDDANDNIQGPQYEACGEDITETCMCGTDVEESGYCCAGIWSEIPCLNCEDSDNDGFYSELGCGTKKDCDDSDPQIHPNATEICSNNIDEDCDGKDLKCELCPNGGIGNRCLCGTAVKTSGYCCYGKSQSTACTASCNDKDNDRFYGEEGCGGSVDCNDSNPKMYPGAPEICGNGLADDCEGADVKCPACPETITERCYCGTDTNIFSTGYCIDAKHYSYARCAEGPISSSCVCDAAVKSSGFCCAYKWQQTACS